MIKPRLLDLFSGVGGAARGYQQAGFYVVGVDIRPQPHYAGDEFVQADALTYPLDGFDAVHASPPCQWYSDGTRSGKVGAQPLIAPTRDRLAGLSVPWVIENVHGAAEHMSAGLMLCGSMFDLPVRRHRLFESSQLFWGPGQHDCRRMDVIRLRYPVPEAWPLRPTGAHLDRAYSVTGKSRGRGCIEFWRGLMDMPWAVTAHELSEAIPPAYTEWIGTQLLASLERAA